MKRALVLGGAECVSLDFAKAMELFNPDKIYAVNDIGAHVERVDVWCTLHPEFMDKWEEQRRKRGFSSNYEVVAPLNDEVGLHVNKGRIARRISYCWKGVSSSASSGIYAAKVALEDGHDRVVLAGVPMTAEGGHFLPHIKNGRDQIRGKLWTDQGSFVPGFLGAVPYLKGRVKSMSGWTRELLGVPDAEWLGTLVGETDRVVGGCPVNGD